MSVLGRGSFEACGRTILNNEVGDYVIKIYTLSISYIFPSAASAKNIIAVPSAAP
jgi:hypothetical protein